MKFSLSVSFCSHTHYLPLARAAERGLWHSINVADGLFYYETPSNDYPYTPDGSRFWHGKTHFPDPFIAVGMMAAATERIQFFTNIFKLPVRNPYLVAKETATLACMSNHRFALGVGLSPWQDDFSLCGQEWANRGPRCGEMIEVIRKLHSGEMVEHQGKYYQFEPMQMAPVPKDQPMPIYIGGLAEPVLRRAARLADGWLSVNAPLDDIVAKMQQLRTMLLDNDRDPASFEFKVMATDIADLDGFSRLAELGVTEAVVMPQFFYGGNPGDLDYKIESTERFSEEVIAKLQ